MIKWDSGKRNKKSEISVHKIKVLFFAQEICFQNKRLRIQRIEFQNKLNDLSEFLNKICLSQKKN